LPYSAGFAKFLLASHAPRIVVDTFTAGDGSQGKRTAESPFAAQADYDWREEAPAQALYRALQGREIAVGWSADGFVGIPYR
jgi:hypothetical protein